MSLSQTNATVHAASQHKNLDLLKTNTSRFCRYEKLCFYGPQIQLLHFMVAPKPDLEFMINKLKEIPSLPAVVYELSRVINDPMSSTKEVQDIMAQDIGMTTKVLKLANSAYYAIPGGVTSLARAIQFIGFDTIHQLVLSASIIKALDTRSGSTAFSVNEFWKHSVGVAISSEVIAKYLRHPNPSDAFTCGLTHDMGKLALYIISSDALVYVMDQAQKTHQSFIETELSLNYTTHCELGRILAENWKLPKVLQATSRYHHESDMHKRSMLSAELNQYVDIVTLANLLIHALKFGNSGHTIIRGAPNELLDRLRITPQEDIPVIVKRINASLDSASEFIQMITGAAG
jgi:HD-like signal output (HDOD) protein